MASDKSSSKNSEKEDSKQKDSDKKKHRTAGRRPFWSGAISFGLVTVPIELFPSIKSSKVPLRMLDEDGTPLSRRYYNPDTDELIERENIVRGYEVDDGEFVLVDDDELEAIAPKKSREIDLRRFVKLEEIPPFFHDRAYFLTPDGDSNKAYRLLARVMEETDRAGIATFVMRGKEYLVAIIAEDGILRAQMLRFEAEVRSPADIGLPDEQHRDEEKVKEYYRAIDENIEEALDRSELQDEQAEKVKALAKKKQDKNEGVVETGEASDDQESSQDDGSASADDDEQADLLETIRGRLQQENGQADTEAESVGSEESQGGEGKDTMSDLTKDELYEKAQEADIAGRSKMAKGELIKALTSDS